MGDLFELLRYSLEKILRHRRSLLDGLATLETVYVPGNRAEATVRCIDGDRLPHAFFERTCRALTCRVGPKRFKFMHGHEVDPLIAANAQSLGRMIGAVAYLFEFRPGTYCLSNERVTDLLLETSESVLQLWDRITKGMNRAVRDCCDLVPGAVTVFDWNGRDPEPDHTVVAHRCRRQRQAQHPDGRASLWPESFMESPQRDSVTAAGRT